jgi:hypothetical protein
MKTTTSVFARKAAISASAFLITAAAGAQTRPVPAPIGGLALPSAVYSGALQTTSNPWGSLPTMSVDHCLAEALGTVSDPATGAPVHASADPQTGRPLCPSAQPNSRPQPPRI